MDCQLPPSDPLQVRGVPLPCSGALLDFLEHAVGQDLCCALVEILAALPMGVCLYNAAKQVIYINPYARNLLGITDASQPATEIWQNIHLFEEDSAAAPNHPRPYPKENLLKPQGQHPAVDERRTVTLQYGDRRMTIELEVRPIFNRSGEMQLGLITFQDIRDRHRDATEHQHLINHLRQQADRYYSLVQRQTDFLICSRADTVITFANTAFCRAFERAVTDVIGQPWATFVLPEDLPALLAKVQALTPDAPTFTNENRVCSPQGIKYTQWINLGIFDDAGQLVEIQSVGRDISMLKEQLLREQALNRVIQAIRNSLDLETIFATVVEEVGKLWLKLDCVVVQYLPHRHAWVRRSEYRQDPNWPHHIGYEVSDADNPMAAQLKAGHIIQISDASEITDPVLKPLTEMFPGAWLIVPLRVEEQTWGALGVFTTNGAHQWSAAEISLMTTIATQLEVAIYQAKLYQRAQEELAQRRRIEAALRDSEERFRSTAMNVPGAIFRYLHFPDGHSQVFYLNPMCEKLWGVPAGVAAADGSALWQLVHPDDRPAMLESVEKSARTLQPWFWQWRIIHPNGDIRWLEGAGQPERRDDGAVMWYTLVLDVSDRHAAQERLQEQQAQLDLAVQASNIGFYFCDLRTQTAYVSPTYKAQLGYPANAAEASPKDWASRLHPEDRERAVSAFQRFLRGEAAYSIDFRLRHRDGSYRWIHSKAVLIRDSLGQPCKVVGTHIDITDRKTAEMALRESEERYRLLAENMNDIVCVHDPAGHCLYISPSYEALLGRKSTDLISQHFSELSHPEDRAQVRQELAQMIQQNKFWPLTHRVCTASGETLWLETLIKPRYDDQGQLQRLQTTSRDVTARLKVQNQLHYEAYHDMLTGLPNRLYLMEQLEAAISEARRNPRYHYAVVFLDLDAFKVINDSLGHAIGDRVLVEFARLLRSLIHRSHTVARFGGDEFVILMSGLSHIQEVIAPCEGIITRLQDSINVDERQIFVSSSLGIVFAQNEYLNSLEVLRNADIAMYEAKGHQRGRYAIFNQGMYKQVLQRLHIEHDLRRALEQDELRVFYQPFFDLQEQRLVGFEALVRWYHPERGLISPAEFIPIAEDTGLIVALDQWVLRHACQQLTQWYQQYPSTKRLILSVNVSAKTLKHPNFLAHLDHIQQEFRLAEGRLILELTERIALELNEEMRGLLSALSDRHIEISIDDFGTGYSCLSYLHSLPIQHLKVDRSFVSQLENNQRNYQITQMILVLTHQLGYRAIAEGIETADQLQLLRELGCDYGQGYLFARPAPASAIEPLLQAL
jgi:diguanylate cyclase (GGDEF)-like protein/PAS domain S-box-containing protein